MRFARRLKLGCLLLGLMIVIPLAAQTVPPVQVASPPAAAPATLQKLRPTTYGTSTVSYIQVPATEFLPVTSSCGFQTDNTGLGTRWSTTINCPFVAGLHLPSGAKPISLELDFVDTNPTFTLYVGLVDCDYLGQSCTYHPVAGAGPADCSTSGLICSGVAFEGGAGQQSADLTPDGITVDGLRSYRLIAYPYAGNESLKIAGMIVGYVLQVSPAPVAATFNDVPVSDPAFRYIEAFNAAAITAGCSVSPALYCPDNFVTRRQMAVFFAKALGLQFN